ncbi:J domain-containing protein [Luteimonas dalianensis]|uniref:J domain-containing protein n=1 Tax=Luteimonas dalianensis TaxID=1148196 RepID=UPI003BEFF443
MIEQTDFMVLYRELGIGPDSSVDGLRMAYRRRVADLHPDRGGDEGGDALKALNQRYAAAIDFHRHHGRLPGAAPRAPAARPLPSAEPQAQVPVALEEEPLQERQPPSKFVRYGIVLVAAGAAWWFTHSDVPLPGFLDGVAGSQRGIEPSAAIALRQGMQSREVIAILGDPVSRELGGVHWEYGPSWVRFECGQVVDWYSSPLHPLKASRSRPQEPAGSASAGIAPRCPPGS